MFSTTFNAKSDTFVIVTACNPLGEILSDIDNARLHKNLADQLQLQNLSFREILGASPDLVHQEKSFAIDVNVERGIALAQQHQQNAIYQVQNDQLWLIPVLMNQSESLYLGRFSQRLRSLGSEFT